MRATVFSELPEKYKNKYHPHSGWYFIVITKLYSITAQHGYALIKSYNLFFRKFFGYFFSKKVTQLASLASPCFKIR